MINRLCLRNFRNYRDQTVEFNPGISVFEGYNGQGKTNLLEAIYFISILRSFRTSNHQNLKNIGTKGFYIGANILNDGWEKLIEVEYSEKRQLLIDHNKVSKSSNFIGQFTPIVFTNEDIRIITDTSRVRRRYLDILISLLDKDYMLCLKDYMNALESVNCLLKRREYDRKILEPFIRILADKGLSIIRKRYEITEILSNKACETLKKIKGLDHTIEIKYQSKMSKSDLDCDLIVQQIKKNIEKEKNYGYCTTGPHSDDLEILYNNKNLRTYGSLGQCRAAVLAIKMSEMSILKEKCSRENVIALVDDVTGELDDLTKHTFFNSFNDIKQVFFTFTNFKSENFFSNASRYKVHQGEIRKL